MKNVQSDGLAPMFLRVSSVMSMSRAFDRHITMISRSVRMRPFFLPCEDQLERAPLGRRRGREAHVDDVHPGVGEHGTPARTSARG